MRGMTYLSLFLLLAIPCSAATINVNWDGSADYTTIQAGINAAVSGADTVVVAEGTYIENITFGGKNITLESTDPNDWDVVQATIIDGSALGSVVTFSGTETSLCELTGFTITGGAGSERGGGIDGNFCAATITKCVVTDNYADWGAGIADAAGIITNCIISANTGSSMKAGGGLVSCHGNIANCLIIDNYGGNGGGLYNCDGNITNCTIADNDVTYHGGGLSRCDGNVTNCIIWGNKFEQMFYYSTPAFSCIQDWSAGGTGNINTDPEFVDPCSGDYHLQPWSSCIDAGTNSPPGGLPSEDLDGQFRPIDGDNDMQADSDMGCYESSLSPDPVIKPSAKLFEFAALLGGANPDDQVLTIRNSGGSTLNWEITEACDWLQVNPTSGSSAGEPNDVTLSVDITDLSPGNYNCQVTVSDVHAANNPQTVEIDLLVRGPTIGLSPTGFEFSAYEGGINPDSQTLSVSNSGFATLNWEISESCSWLEVDPCSGSSTGEVDEVAIGVDISGFGRGSYNCQLTVSDPWAANNPQYVNVALDIIGPIIELSATEFSFWAELGGPNPQNQILTIRNSGGGTLNWTIEPNSPCPWLWVEPTTGSSMGEPSDVALSVDTSDLSTGDYSCQLTVSDSNAVNSPQTVQVSLVVAVIRYVPSEYSTIQAAINAAGDGDIIIVADDTYTGSGNRDIDFKGKAITLRSAGGPQACIIDCENPFPDHRAFYFHSGEGADSVVSGFTIKRGRVGRDSDSNGRGAGIYCTGSSPTFEDCIITNNRASGDSYGGGIYCTSSSSTFVDCVISNNTAAGNWHARGGGVYGGNLTFVNCVINSNSASGARGDDEQGLPPSPANDGGYGKGGGLYGDGIKIVNCIITGNTTSGGDGGMGWEYGANGGSAYGAGVYGSSLIVKNCFFSGNSASGGTGGDGDTGGAGGDGGSAQGGAVYTVSANIRNCTIIDNSVIGGIGGSPGGASGTSSGGGVYGASSIFDCIIWGNGDDLAGGASATYSCIEDIDSGTGNIHVDPMFVSGLLGDYYLSQIAAGQASDSPCVDAGSDTAVKAGLDKYTTRTDKRGDEGIRDMGYHYLENIADLNEDGYVNMDDVLIMGLQWLDTPGIPSADIAPEPLDNFVDYQDFSVIRQHWQWP